jgi:Domain of unknown function (DUF6484)
MERAMRSAAGQDAPESGDERLLEHGGVVIGVLLGFVDESRPLVAFPGNPGEAAIEAKTIGAVSATDIGHEVALLFEDGDLARPLVIGRIKKAGAAVGAPAVAAEVDGESLVLDAKNEIVLRCGKASITLTRAGKVIIRGEFVLSHSSGVNRIRGGSVQIN